METEVAAYLPKVATRGQYSERQTVQLPVVSQESRKVQQDKPGQTRGSWCWYHFLLTFYRSAASGSGSECSGFAAQLVGKVFCCCSVGTDLWYRLCCVLSGWYFQSFQLMFSWISYINDSKANLFFSASRLPPPTLDTLSSAVSPSFQTGPIHQVQKIKLLPFHLLTKP